MNVGTNHLIAWGGGVGVGGGGMGRGRGTSYQKTARLHEIQQSDRESRLK